MIRTDKHRDKHKNKDKYKEENNDQNKDEDKNSPTNLSVWRRWWEENHRIGKVIVGWSRRWLLLIQMLDNDSDAELSADQEALATNPVGHKVGQN